MKYHIPDIRFIDYLRLFKTVASGWLTEGKRVAECETILKNENLCFPLMVSSATAGLHLALESLGIGKGDEVITTTYTYIATVQAIEYSGAKPILADCKTDYNIDPEEIKKKIKKKTKAIIPVHFGGRLCDMKAINKIARQHNLHVVEDCAHRVPIYRDTDNIRVFSFYANKILTSGEGGAVLFKDLNTYTKGKHLYYHGRDYSQLKRTNEVVCKGYKYNMSDINASILIGQLKRMKWNIQKRQQVAKWYDKYIGMNKFDKNNHYHLFPLPAIMKQKLDLKTNKIPFSHHYKPVHEQTAYKQAGFPIASGLSRKEISLPIHPFMKKKDVKYICDLLGG